MNRNAFLKVVFVAAGLIDAVGTCRAAGPCGESFGPAAPERTAIKERAHIFAVNGLDPLGVADFNGLCTSLRGRGYQNTRFGRLYQSGGFVQEIRRLREKDPGAAVVLIGFSYGCNRVRAIANELDEQGVRVDLLVYIAGDLIRDEQRSRPGNVCRVLNIRSKGMALLGGDLLFNRDDIAGACNVRLACRHLQTPSRPETLDLIIQQLTALAVQPPAASNVPVGE